MMDFILNLYFQVSVICLIGEVLPCDVIQTIKEKFNSSGSKKKHGMENRWTRFEGEPDINVKQSLKKRRGVLFGRVSRQGCLGNTGNY